jgi:hypothetical protein
MARAIAKTIDLPGFVATAPTPAGKYRGFSANFAGRELPARRSRAFIATSISF